MKAWATLVRESVINCLKNDPMLSEVVGQRIFASRYEAWGGEELPVLGVYLLSQSPIETNLNPPPDERRLELSIEALAMFDEKLEETLELVAERLRQILTLPALGKYLVDNKLPDVFLKIDWQNDELALAEGGELTIGLLVVNFSLEIQIPWPPPDDLPDFLEAGSSWRAKSAEGQLEADNLIKINQAEK